MAARSSQRLGYNDDRGRATSRCLRREIDDGIARRSGTFGRMPEISRFFGIVVRMYFLDHAPPHFHAAYAGAEARIRIRPIGLLSGQLPPRALALVVEWATLHEGELFENWRRLHSDESPTSIPPLE